MKRKSSISRNLERIAQENHEERIRQAKLRLPADPDAQNWVLFAGDDTQDPCVGTLDRCLDLADIAPKSMRHWRSKAIRDGYISVGGFGSGAAYQRFYVIEWHPVIAAAILQKRAGA